MIKGPVTYVPTVTVYEGDTLLSDPKEIIDSCYYRRSAGDAWVFLERINITFRDHNLVRFTLETNDHIKTIVNTIYYEKEIDDERLISKRKQYGDGDSSLYGSSHWYDKKGNNVKTVQAVSAEMRTLKVFRYDSLNRLSELWERALFSKDVSDSVYNNRTLKTEYRYKEGFKIAATRRYNNTVLIDSTAAGNEDVKDVWRYEFDKKGNWIRREGSDGLEYVERKIVY